MFINTKHKLALLQQQSQECSEQESDLRCTLRTTALVPTKFLVYSTDHSQTPEYPTFLVFFYFLQFFFS